VWRRAALAALLLICIIPHIAKSRIGESSEIGQIIMAKRTVMKFPSALINKTSLDSENSLPRNDTIVSDKSIFPRFCIAVVNCDPSDNFIFLEQRHADQAPRVREPDGGGPHFIFVPWRRLDVRDVD
jgi:hypothetical protein